MSEANDNQGDAPNPHKAKAVRDLLNWVRNRGSMTELGAINVDALNDEDLERLLCGAPGPGVVQIPHLGRCASRFR